jgi:putative transposase
MPTKRHKPKQIMTLLRQVEVVIANGKLTPQACREAGISEQTCYRWCKEYGGLKLDQAKRLKAPERENAKLKRFVAELRWRSRSCRTWRRETCKPRAAPGAQWHSRARNMRSASARPVGCYTSGALPKPSLTSCRSRRASREAHRDRRFRRVTCLYAGKSGAQAMKTKGDHQGCPVIAPNTYANSIDHAFGRGPTCYSESG